MKKRTLSLILATLLLLSALKICLGWKRFALYILYVIMFSWASGLLIDLLL